MLKHIYLSHLPCPITYSKGTSFSFKFIEKREIYNFLELKGIIQEWDI